MLGHYKRVLMIGAHPDDEDTELLTILVRGMGAEAAYLSLNRGEGGQNLIGPELGEALGLIRTEELLAARRLDGARQYFTRAYDFGYSKTIDETWQHWPRDTVLKDVVRIVRRFRPQIIVTIFSGTPRDGHGQHQAAGWVGPGGLPDRGRLEPLPGAVPGGRAGPLESVQALPQRPLRYGRHDAHPERRRARSGRREVLSPDRHGRPQPASLAGHGAAAANRPVAGSTRPGRGPHRRWRRALRRHRHDSRRHAAGRARGRGIGHAGSEAGRNPRSFATPPASIRSWRATGNPARRKSLLARAAADLDEAVAQPPRASSGERGVYYTRGIELEDQLGASERGRVASRTRGVRCHRERRPGRAGAACCAGRSPPGMPRRSPASPPCGPPSVFRSPSVTPRTASRSLAAIQPGQVATDTVDYPVSGSAAVHSVLPPAASRRRSVPLAGGALGRDRHHRWAALRGAVRVSHLSRIGRGECRCLGQPGASRLDGSGLSLQRPGSGRGAPAGDGGAPDRREARSGHRGVAHQFARPSSVHRHPDPRCPGHDLGHGGPSAAAGLASGRRRSVSGSPAKTSAEPSCST